MSKRSIWIVFSIIFMVAGAVLAAMFAHSYLSFLKTGNWPGVNAIKSQHPSVPVPESVVPAAKYAFLFAGMLVGYLCWTLVCSLYKRLRTGIEAMSVQDKIAFISGLLLGLLLTVLISGSLELHQPAKSLIIAVFLCWLCIAVTFSMKEQLRFYIPATPVRGKQAARNFYSPKILDTNVIIDGRIADICRAGFVEGPIYIPRFVLEELQLIADSSDSLKRARGRRGLDILNEMQQEMSMQIETYESGYGITSDEVDGKLVELAKEINGSIVTNDYNLNKVAGLQGVKVLNVNELANALKPVVLPGEEMVVLIIKEGKEQSQGVAYLDDGTMVVVEGGINHIGETLPVMVTSILQTSAGKMIFAEIGDIESREEDTQLERNVRSYAGGRQRKKIR